LLLEREAQVDVQAFHRGLAVSLGRQAVATRRLDPDMPDDLGDSHETLALTHEVPQTPRSPFGDTIACWPG
jgi:hypothetical protein